MSIYGTPEEYSRFLRKDWIDKDNNVIKAKAFLPPNRIIESVLEVSCFETQYLTIDEIQNLATINNITLNSKPPVGHCTIEEKDFPFKHLSLDRNYIPERHINIVGWNRYPNKEDRIELATILAVKSSCKILKY